MSAPVSLLQHGKSKRSIYNSFAATYYFVARASCRGDAAWCGGRWERKRQHSSATHLGRRIEATTAEEPCSTAFLLQRLSVAIQQGNAASVTGTSPLSAKLENILFIYGFYVCQFACLPVSLSLNCLTADSHFVSSFARITFCRSY